MAALQEQLPGYTTVALAQVSLSEWGPPFL